MNLDTILLKKTHIFIISIIIKFSNYEIYIIYYLKIFFFIFFLNNWVIS